MRGQGDPFAVEIVDLNRDGRIDVLTSNHQGDQCFKVTKTEILGRALAIEQPADGEIFSSDWTVHVIKDDIRAGRHGRVLLSGLRRPRHTGTRLQARSG